MITHRDEDQLDLDFEEFRIFDEIPLEFWIPLKRREVPEREGPGVWAVAGENGGLLVKFDPELFLMALRKVTLPGLSATAEGRSNKVEVAIFEHALRMRSQSPYITFEAEIPLPQPVRDLPAEGLAFLIKPHRLEPFHTRTYVRRRGEERQVRKHRASRTDFDSFEYVVDEQAVVISIGHARLGLKVEPTDPSAALFGDPGADAAASVPTSALVQALRCISFATVPARLKKTSEGVFQGIHCAALIGTRAAAYTNEALAGLKLAMPLDTPLKLATMLARLPDPAFLTIQNGRALLEAGGLRCTFAACQQGLPQLDLEGHIKECANSTWKFNLDDLQKLWGTLLIIAREGSEVDLLIEEDAGEISLKSIMREASSEAEYRMKLEQILPSEASHARSFRTARILFSDLAKAMERIVGQPKLSINARTVILTDTCENDQRHYFIGNRDTRSA